MTGDPPVTGARFPVERLFDSAQPPRAGEAFETLLERGGLKIERILSAPGTASGPFLQEADEWVLLLRGPARLDLDGEALSLAAGEALFIPAGTPHKVLETSDSPTCIWLAFHWRPAEG